MLKSIGKLMGYYNKIKEFSQELLVYYSDSTDSHMFIFQEEQISPEDFDALYESLYESLDRDFDAKNDMSFLCLLTMPQQTIESLKYKLVSDILPSKTPLKVFRENKPERHSLKENFSVFNKNSTDKPASTFTNANFGLLKDVIEQPVSRCSSYNSADNIPLGVEDYAYAA